MDAGTVGASGIYGVGRDSVGLGDLHFAPAGNLDAADLIAVEPVSGAAQARRVVTRAVRGAVRRSAGCSRRRRTRPRRPRADRKAHSKPNTTRTIARATVDEVGDRDALVDRVGELDPGRPGHHARDAAGAPEPHVGAPRHARDPRLPAGLGADGGAHEPGERVVRRRLAGGELPAAPAQVDGAVGRRGDAASTAARACAGASPTRTGARPSKTSRSGTLLDHSPACDAPDEQRVRAARGARISGCSTSAFSARSCAASAAWTGR